MEATTFLLSYGTNDVRIRTIVGDRHIEHLLFLRVRLNVVKQNERLDLLQGTLDMMVMQTLLSGKANGYEIAKAIGRVSEDVLTVDHGSLYPALSILPREWGSGQHRPT